MEVLFWRKKRYI